MNIASTGIGTVDINFFRVGNFLDASSDIKDKWHMVMLDLLPCICKKYLKAVKASVLVTKITTVSDEALLLWLSNSLCCKLQSRKGNASGDSGGNSAI